MNVAFFLAKAVEDPRTDSPAPSPSSSWFSVPPDYVYPAWHIALVVVLTTSAAVGAVATAYLASKHCHLAGSAAMDKPRSSTDKGGYTQYDPREQDLTYLKIF